MNNQIKIIEEAFFARLWNERALKVADKIFTDHFVTESIGLDKGNWIESHGRGPESMKHHIKWWLDAIPDIRFEVIDIASTEDTAVYHWKAKGTMKGAMYGVKATNGAITIFGLT